MVISVAFSCAAKILIIFQKSTMQSRSRFFFYSHHSLSTEVHTQFLTQSCLNIILVETVVISIPEMNQNLSFLFGLLIGLSFTLMCFYPQKSAVVLSVNSEAKLSDKNLLITVNLYNETLAEKLYNEVRILCWIMTTPENHKKKAFFVKQLWGSRCNKLLFFSTSTDAELGSIALPVKEGRNTLWDKTKNAFQYIYKHNFNDADWFLKADDDSYVIPENLRQMLYSYNPTISLYFGHRYAVEFGPNDFSSYMAGGGYLLSKKALEKFATKIVQNSSICSMREDGNEDWEIGRCLETSAISVDERDENMGKRFFPAGVQEHLKPHKDLKYW